MPVITNQPDLQRGTLWGQFISALLFGFYSCLLVVTLWRPEGTGRPLTAIGWIIIAIYFLTLCRVVVDCRILQHMLLDRGSMDSASADYGFQQGFSSAAALLSDGLFCWRLYMIWSRSIRVIIVPACLLVLNAVGFITIAVITFLMARWPINPRLLAINFPLFIAAHSVVIAYTCYITIFIVGRLWWVGREANKIESPDRPKPNRYSGAISALIQSGGMYSATMVLTIIAAVKMDFTMILIVDRIAASVNGISATLLVLQLDMFQKQTGDRDPPLTTGATINFAVQEGSSFSGASLGPVPRRRRASMSMAVYRPREPATVV
ncbi:hypothetical protein FRB94_000674 [Tulasnella sp. JGI-2019a]|nr:hypothetical protein FRB93_011913 [Tulasnella sp. JGI-2019a]KAG9006436.1 hypothetical protein FRB94_000674 [Tulasnella sp. JGI-2019a]